MNMAEIAVDVGVSEATVSRVLSGLTIQCPQGNILAKSLFCEPVSYCKQPTTRHVAFEMIKRLIAAEDKFSPLNDGEIACEMQKLGLSISRRTVAKYRNHLGLSSPIVRRKSAELEALSKWPERQILPQQVERKDIPASDTEGRRSERRGEFLLCLSTDKQPSPATEVKWMSLHRQRASASMENSGTDIPSAQVTLQPFSNDDADEIFEALQDCSLARWLAALPVPVDAESGEKYLQFLQDPEIHASILRIDRRFAGLVSLGSELTFWIRTDLQGKGLGTWAVREFLRQLPAGIAKITACCMLENRAAAQPLDQAWLFPGWAVFQTVFLCPWSRRPVYTLQTFPFA